MSTIPILLLAWIVQTIVAAIVLTPVLFLARKRVHWRPWELLSLVFPFSIWVALHLSPLSTGWKSLANLAIEPAILGLALGVGALARVVMSRRMPEGKAALVAQFGVWAAAVVIFWAVPGLEE